MGYTALHDQLLTIPVFASALPFYFDCRIHVRQTREVNPVAHGWIWVALVGWLLAITATSETGVRFWVAFI